MPRQDVFHHLSELFVEVDITLVWMYLASNYGHIEFSFSFSFFFSEAALDC